MRLTDQQIQAMSRAERQELIRRLAVGGTRRVAERVRRWRLAFVLLCVAALVPWTVYLAVTLPSRYEARNWVATWVGFDVVLTVMLVLTAVFGYRRRPLLFPTAFASGVLLLCDAWFDVLTSHPGADRLQAVISALVLELPLAVVLITGPARMLRSVPLDPER